MEIGDATVREVLDAYEDLKHPPWTTFAEKIERLYKAIEKMEIEASARKQEQKNLYVYMLYVYLREANYHHLGCGGSVVMRAEYSECAECGLTSDRVHPVN